MGTTESEICKTQAAETDIDQFMMSDDPSIYIIQPRIGDQYQTKIPALATNDAIDSVYGKELFITVMQINNEDYHIRDLLLGTPTSWSNTESQAFLLGLYIFGKNMIMIKNFVESKKMEDILAYYYGQFYKSDAYSRWSKLRKVRSERCIIGDRIVKGYTQQQFISHLLPTMSKEIQNMLLEVTNIFNKESVSLEEYVSTLKAKVGINALIDAIGIGKGKNDLTGMIPNHGRTSQDVSFQIQLQLGKTLSSISSEDIHNLLNSGSWRSKAKLNGLFSEVVWPRLVARGWQSEQPTGLSYHVFLVPGVKKFSRKELSKGVHYFDSITDVLNVVERDPGLLDLDKKGSVGNISIDDEKGNLVGSKFRNSLSSNLHHYLHPGVSICSSEDITIIDISMFEKDGIFNIRKRCSRAEITRQDSYNKEENSNACLSNADFCASNEVKTNSSKIGLTMKALDAHACGSVCKKRKRSDKKSHSQRNQAMGSSSELLKTVEQANIATDNSDSDDGCQ